MRTEEVVFEEITLADLAKTIYRRRVLMAVTFALCLVAGGAITVLTTPQYQASGTVIPLGHDDIVRSWLSSRRAAEISAEAVGERLYGPLFPSTWDDTQQTWRGSVPTSEEIGVALQKHVSVSAGIKSANTPLTVSVTLPDAVLARDVTSAYLAGLEQLRPDLENITRSELFDKYYDGSNAIEAQQRAQAAASEKNYWIVWDLPAIPDERVRPQPGLYMTLAAVGGLAAALALVALVEWLSRYRAEFQRVDAPPR